MLKTANTQAGTFGCPNTVQRFTAKRTCILLLHEKQAINSTNAFYTEKRVGKRLKPILADTFQIELNRINEVFEEGDKQTF